MVAHFFLKTERLIISEFNEDMIESVWRNSLDEDNRRFVPDEVFETIEDAKQTVLWLIGCYGNSNEPQVHPIMLHNGKNIGYVQAVPTQDGWEIGYHVAKAYTSNGYATEAVRAFLPTVMKKLAIERISGICLSENVASRRVMEKCGFVLLREGTGDYQGSERTICDYIFTAHDAQLNG